MLSIGYLFGGDFYRLTPKDTSPRVDENTFAYRKVNSDSEGQPPSSLKAVH